MATMTIRVPEGEEAKNRACAQKIFYFSSCNVDPIYYHAPMTRKSHSWSPASTRGKSADPSGSFTPSQLGDQLVLRTRCFRGDLNSGRSQGDLISRSNSISGSLWPLDPCRSSGVLVLFSILRIPFAIIRILFAIIRASSRTFAIFSPPPPPPGGRVVRPPELHPNRSASPIAHR